MSEQAAERQEAEERANWPMSVDVRGCVVVRTVSRWMQQGDEWQGARAERRHGADWGATGQRGGAWCLRCWIELHLEKTFERLVQLPGVAFSKRAPSASGGLGAPGCIFLACAAVRPFFFNTGLLLKSSPARTLPHSAGDSEAGPERAHPLIKPSSRGPPLRLP